MLLLQLFRRIISSVQQLTLEAMRAWRAFLEAHSRVTSLLAAELERGAGLQLA